MTRRALVAATLAAVCAVVVPSVARAGEPPADQTSTTDATLTLTVGIDGGIAPGRGYPVLVHVAAERLVAGTLTVSVTGDSGVITTTVPVEVAGGTTKRFVVVGGGSFSFGAVTAELREGDDVVARAASNTTMAAEIERVGVLGDLGETLGRRDVALAVDLGTARLTELTPDVVAAGPVALEVFDVIAAGAGDLAPLSAVERRAITTWVGQGGHLLIDAPAGTTVEGLPPGWDPAPGIARTVDLGQVRFTDGRLALAQWESVLTPTPTRSQVEDGIIAPGFPGGDLSASLATDAGFRLPALFSILVVLGFYIFVVGPLIWLVFSRVRRTTALWVAIPVIAIVSTGVVQVIGAEFRRTGDAVHVTLVESSEGGGMATSAVFVTSRSGGKTSVGLPEGWVQATQPFGGGEQLTTLLEGTGGASTVPVDAGPGGAAIVRGRGPADLEGALVVTAFAPEDGTIRGEVRNDLAVSLSRVAIFTSRSTVVDIGTLAPGEVREWETDQATHFDFNAQPEATVWPDPFSFGAGFEAVPVPVGPDGQIIEGKPIIPGGAPVDAVNLDADRSNEPSSLGGYAEVAGSRGANFKPPGEVVAVGWTRELDAPVSVAGRVVSEGRTGIVARAPVVAEGDRMADTVPVRFVVRGPDATQIKDPQRDQPSTVGTVFGFVLPPAVGERAVDPARLRFHLPSLFEVVEVWTGDGWTLLPEVAPGGAETDVPDGGIVEGTVFVRLAIPIDQVPGPGREFVLYEAPS